MSEIVTLNAGSDSVKYLCSKDKHLAKVISMVGPITYKPYKDPFPFLVHEIIEQMLSTKASEKIYGRLTDLCQGSVCPDVITRLTDDEIKSIGTSSLKVKYIRSLTEAVNTGYLDFKSLQDLTSEEIMSHLTSVCGVGSWTAKMYLIFCLDQQDVLPFEDVAFLQGYAWLYKTDDWSRTSVEKKCRKWRPYSAIAARYLYRALDMGLTKDEFHLYK